MPQENMHTRLEMLSCHDYKVVRFGPGVNTQFSHDSGTSIERVKITKLLQ